MQQKWLQMFRLWLVTGGHFQDFVQGCVCICRYSMLWVNVYTTYNSCAFDKVVRKRITNIANLRCRRLYAWIASCWSLNRICLLSRASSIFRSRKKSVIPMFTLVMTCYRYSIIVSSFDSEKRREIKKKRHSLEHLLVPLKPLSK